MPTINPNLKWREERDKIVIMKAEGEFYEVTGKSGKLIWKLCDGKHTVDEIVNSLIKHFRIIGEDKKETVRKDTVELLKQLEAESMITWR